MALTDTDLDRIRQVVRQENEPLKRAILILARNLPGSLSANAGGDAGG